MTSPNEPRQHGQEFEPQDPVESGVSAIPIVQPVVGAAHIILMAINAVYMA